MFHHPADIPATQNLFSSNRYLLRPAPYSSLLPRVSGLGTLRSYTAPPSYDPRCELNSLPLPKLCLIMDVGVPTFISDLPVRRSQATLAPEFTSSPCPRRPPPTLCHQIPHHTPTHSVSLCQQRMQCCFCCFVSALVLLDVLWSFSTGGSMHSVEDGLHP
ncbi:hypothetical protein Hypma_014415 [Hypsizygus marmoreus]|uniref:Uncharacterized protein n=1 Tax=Hypsizygus marmoreus TaxID=39966 RepID=A0A369JAT0_HYPMA|nr:hypothetical protein Hypma_014415 [Hypsizygus marmoreus]